MKSLTAKIVYPVFFGIGLISILHTNAGDENENGKKKKKEKSTAAVPFSLNNKSVKIYPDAFKREMHVVSKEKTETQFIVFDTEGTMVVNRSMKEAEHIKLSGLKKGFYTFHLFDGDEEKATGKFEIR
jgi:hypothetical protein